MVTVRQGAIFSVSKLSTSLLLIEQNPLPQDRKLHKSRNYNEDFDCNQHFHILQSCKLHHLLQFHQETCASFSPACSPLCLILPKVNNVELVGVKVMQLHCTTCFIVSNLSLVLRCCDSQFSCNVRCANQTCKIFPSIASRHGNVDSWRKKSNFLFSLLDIETHGCQLTQNWMMLLSFGVIAFWKCLPQ